MTAEVGEHVNDAELAARFQQEPQSFTLVYDLYFRDVYRYLAGRLGEETADDLAADTFLTAFGRRERFQPERRSLRAWLFGIATDLVARHRRDEVRHYRARARAGAGPAAEVRLMKALATLSSGERDVLLLVSLGRLSDEEVAGALGIPFSTAGSRLSGARTKLRKLINEEMSNG